MSEIVGGSDTCEHYWLRVPIERPNEPIFQLCANCSAKKLLTQREWKQWQQRNLTDRPRRAKQRHIPWTEIALGGWFAIAGLIGAFIGTFLAQLT